MSNPNNTPVNHKLLKERVAKLTLADNLYEATFDICAAITDGVEDPAAVLQIVMTAIDEHFSKEEADNEE